MKTRGYGEVDVPSLVERPHLYILGRCGSKEAEQLAYVKTRQECLDGLSHKVETSEGVKVSDIMRFFHGDGPEQQFESGEQKGGNAGCSACSGDSRRYCNLTYSFRCPHLSLADRQRIVLAGPAGKAKRNGGIKPFKGMTVAQLKKECRERGLCGDGYKKDLQATLKEHLVGVQRVPAMLINDQERSLENLHLDDEKKLFVETLSLVLGTKDKLRGSDYRETSIAKFAKQLREMCSSYLANKAEITQLLYAKVEERCQKSILRLHNQTFLHAITCEEVIGKPKILTEKKFYGRCIHSLACHAPIQHRIICSRRPGEIITPGIIRMQAEMNEVNKRSSIQEQEYRLSKLGVGNEGKVQFGPNTIANQQRIVIWHYEGMGMRLVMKCPASRQDFGPFDDFKDNAFATTLDLIEHLNNQHQRSIKFETQTFLYWKDFMRWKAVEERMSKSWLVKQKG
ncbi:hypothetical protein ACROYT_G015941 [Oculina patagonica]